MKVINKLLLTVLKYMNNQLEDMSLKLLYRTCANRKHKIWNFQKHFYAFRLTRRWKANFSKRFSVPFTEHSEMPKRRHPLGDFLNTKRCSSTSPHMFRKGCECYRACSSSCRSPVFMKLCRSLPFTTILHIFLIGKVSKSQPINDCTEDTMELIRAYNIFE